MLRREIMSERSCAGLSCALFGLVWLLIGALGLVGAPEGRKLFAGLIFGFGFLCEVAAIMIWRGKPLGFLVASILFFADAVFAVLVVDDWLGKLVAGVLPLCGAAWLFSLYRHGSK